METTWLGAACKNNKSVLQVFKKILARIAKYVVEHGITPTISHLHACMLINKWKKCIEGWACEVVS